MKYIPGLILISMLIVCGCESDSSGSYDTGGGGNAQSAGGADVSQSSSTTAETSLYIDNPPVTIDIKNVSINSSP